MILGALLDAGFQLEKLQKGLAGLNVQGYELTSIRVKRAGISATQFKVVVDEQRLQPTRGLSDIEQILNEGRLPERVKRKSREIFRHLAEVEADAHGVSLEQVHFHEVGAVDSIIDIVGTIFVLDALKIETCYASSLPLADGVIHSAHGVLPAPAPATLKLLALAGAPISSPPGPGRVGELVTPTGAALITALAVFRRPEIRIKSIGSGAGQKDLKDWPNIMRVWLGDEDDSPAEGDLVLLETNIDDMNPQVCGYLMDKLLAEKALDVWFSPIQMKKNRPAILLSVLGPSAHETRLVEIILSEPTTLGVRSRRVERHTAQRSVVEFDSSLGRARSKIKTFGQVVTVAPEYEDCRRIAAETGLPLQEVARIIELDTRRYLQQTSKSE